jgi:hypothetical protein
VSTQHYHWVSISHTHADMKKKPRLYEKIQKLTSKSRACELDENQKMMHQKLVNLMKIRRFWSKHAKSIRLSVDFAYIYWHERKFFVSMTNFKRLHLDRELVDLTKIRKWIRGSWTWWKSSLKSTLWNHLINVTRTHMNEMLNNDDRERYICIIIKFQANKWAFRRMGDDWMMKIADFSWLNHFNLLSLFHLLPPTRIDRSDQSAPT